MYTSNMKTLNEQMIRIARDHGHDADFNTSGGVDVLIEYKHLSTGQCGVERFPVNNLYQLKIALGY